MAMNDQTETIFAKIIRKEIPSIAVYEDDDVYAFLDTHPVNPGHTLVVPKKPSRGFLDAEPDVLKKLIVAVQKISEAVKTGVKADGINLHQNEGATAGQKVFRLHIHIIPRFENDGYEHWHGKPYASEEEAEKTANEIRKNLV